MAEKKKTKKKFKLWQKITLIIAVMCLVAGVGFLAFPAVSNFFGQQRANGIIEDFNNTLDNVVPADNSGKPVSGVTAKSHAEAVEPQILP